MRALWLLAALVAAISLAHAQFSMMTQGPAASGCSNSLNFSQSCNSGYLAVVP